MGIIKKLAESVFNYRIEKLPPLGIHPYKDIAKFIREDENKITVFDVGANEGQSVIQMQENFNPTKIHCFEPNETAFFKLKRNNDKNKIVVTNNFGLGKANETKDFFENELSDMSSFLELGEKGWGRTGAPKRVTIETIDNYCSKNQIGFIDLLKIDTQGFELEVMKGAANALKNNKIHLVLMEVTFAKIYDGLPPFDQLYKLLTESGFRLVTFYGQHYHDGLISWTDVLFINEKINESQKNNL